MRSTRRFAINDRGQRTHKATPTFVRLWWVGALIMVLATGYVAFRVNTSGSVRTGPASDQTATDADSSNSGGFGVEFDNPLGADAHEVPLQAADALLTTYRTAKLPASGPAGPEHVTAAWVDETGELAYELDSGILIIYTPDGRTSDQYAEDADEVISLGELEGTVIPLRGVRALASVKTDSSESSLAWIEGAALVAMYGDGGQSLQELIALAEDMRYQGI